MDKKKITIAVVAVIAVIAIAIIVFLLTKNTNTVYTISFNTDGGNEVVSQEVEEGEKVTKPTDPSKEGYEFLGWYLNGVYFDFQTEVEGNLTLEAKWKEIIKEEQTDINDEEEKIDQDEKDNEEEKVTKYTVTFDSNGGSEVSKKTVEKNKTVKAPTDPTRDGYKFLGWYLGNTKYNFSKKVTKNITLTAKWEKVEEQKPVEPEKPVEPDEPDAPVTPEVKKYTVTFDANGGTSVEKQTIEEGKIATKPKDPTYTGYTFLGWYYNDSLYNFNTKVTGNVTLVAKWEKDAVISHKIESEPDTFVNQVRIFITKDNQKVAGVADIILTDGTVVKNVSIPKEGYPANGYEIKSVTNERVK